MFSKQSKVKVSITVGRRRNNYQIMKESTLIIDPLCSPPHTAYGKAFQKCYSIFDTDQKPMLGKYCKKTSLHWVL